MSKQNVYFRRPLFLDLGPLNRCQAVIFALDAGNLLLAMPRLKFGQLCLGEAAVLLAKANPRADKVWANPQQLADLALGKALRPQ